MEKNSWIDISVTIQDGMVHWPGDERVNLHRTSSINDGEEANVTAISMSAHTGTHIDAPLHFIKDGKDVTQIALDKLTGEANIFQIENEQAITLEVIKNFEINKGDRVLFKTKNSEKDWTMRPFNKNYIYLATDAAKYLKEKGVACIGIDYLSIAGEINGAEVHKILLGAEICIIEGLNLKNIEPGFYEMICLPLKLKGADGAPARVVIRKIE
jgi:arylformamidase